jgi:hypothetical protein
MPQMCIIIDSRPTDIDVGFAFMNRFKRDFGFFGAIVNDHGDIPLSQTMP